MNRFFTSFTFILIFTVGWLVNSRAITIYGLTGCNNINNINDSNDIPCLVSYDLLSNRTCTIATFPWMSPMNLTRPQFIQIYDRNIIIAGMLSRSIPSTFSRSHQDFEVQYNEYNEYNEYNKYDEISWVATVNLDTGEQSKWEIDAYRSEPQFGGIMAGIQQESSSKELVLVTAAIIEWKAFATQLTRFDLEYKNYSLVINPIIDSLLSLCSDKNKESNIIWLASDPLLSYRHMTEFFAYDLLTHQFVYNGTTDYTSLTLVSNIYYDCEKDIIFVVAVLRDDNSVWLCDVFNTSHNKFYVQPQLFLGYYVSDGNNDNNNSKNNNNGDVDRNSEIDANAIDNGDNSENNESEYSEYNDDNVENSEGDESECSEGDESECSEGDESECSEGDESECSEGDESKSKEKNNNNKNNNIDPLQIRWQLKRGSNDNLFMSYYSLSDEFSLSRNYMEKNEHKNMNLLFEVYIDFFPQLPPKIVNIYNIPLKFSSPIAIVF